MESRKINVYTVGTGELKEYQVVHWQKPNDIYPKVKKFPDIKDAARYLMDLGAGSRVENRTVRGDVSDAAPLDEPSLVALINELLSQRK